MNDDIYLRDLKEKGIAVIENYFDNEFCNNSISEIDFAIKKHSKEYISEDADTAGGDIRFYKFENISKSAAEFSSNQYLENIASKYFGKKLKTHFVLGGKVSAEEDKMTNSGGGWHRDSDFKQFKALVYLNDVHSENGPFLFILDSKKKDAKRRKHNIRHNFSYLKKLIKSLKLWNPRYKDSSINSFINKSGNEVFEVTGKKGTVVLFDSSYIHRGKNIEKGVRYSFTNYYFPETKKAYKTTAIKFEKLFVN